MHHVGRLVPIPFGEKWANMALEPSALLES